jgi:hypothetical protein
MIALDEFDDGRAGRRNPMEVLAFREEEAVLLRHKIGSEGHLVHQPKPKGSHHPDQLPGLQINKFSGKAGGDTSCYPAP